MVGSNTSDTRLRAQSETIGLVLTLALVFAGAGMVVAFGSSAMDASQEALDLQRAEKTMTQLDSRSALVALGNTDTQAVDVPRHGSGHLSLDESAGTMSLRIRSLSGGTDRTGSWDLGRVRYEHGDREIAYQGGGVWRKDTGAPGSVMVSPPEFHFRNGTLTLPVITVTGDESFGSRASVTSGSPTTTWHPDAGAGWPNPLDDHTVFVNVTSDYYQGWGHYFEERTDGSVVYDHPNQKVSLELVTPIGTRTVSDAVASLAPTGSFTISGASANPCHGGAGPPATRPYANSYNSSDTDDDYCDQHPSRTGNQGNITYGNTIDVSRGSGGSPIEGDLRSGGAVLTGHGGGHPYVDGDIYYTTTCVSCDRQVSGDDYRISGVPAVSPIDRRVDTVVDDLAVDNDNGGTDTIASGRLVFDEGAGDPDGSDTATLSAGTYFLERVDFSGGDTLDVDTTGGPVTIAVRDYVEVPSSADINVFGDNVARVYVQGDSPLTVGGRDHMLSVDGGDVNVRHDDAPELRVYGKRNFNTTIDGGTFTGVIYAPPGAAGTSSLAIGHGALFGGAVVADTEILTQGSIHYDEALRGKQIVSRDAKVVKITYLHVTESELEITG